MSRSVLAFLFAIAAACASPHAAFAYTSPGEPMGYVSDFAGVLSAQVKADLEVELATLDASTTDQIAIATVSDLGTDYIEHYAVKLFEEWKIGTDKNDNGVLLLIAVNDRRVRIEVGYGLEGALPDSLANAIIRDVMTPRLKAGDYDGAVTLAIHAIEDAVVGEYKGRGLPRTHDWNDWFTVSILVLVGLQWLASILGRSRSVWAGAGLGAVAGIVLASVFHLWVMTGVLATLALAGLGTLFDFAVSNAFNDATNRGLRPPWWTGGSGGFGGSGGGGFGGFGGGSSGGGGASGSW